VIFKNPKVSFHLMLDRKLLSRQQHYDWGLRALKSVLRTAGDGLRSTLATSISDDVEYTTVVRALNFNTLSKLTTVDSTLFLGLVADIFPTAQQSHDPAHAHLVDVIATCCQEMGLIPLDRQVSVDL
jgi:dynein heavy chain 2